MSHRARRRGPSIMGSLCLLLASAAGAGAQSVGLGPRLSFVRADIHTEHATRLWGGVLRLRTSTKTALEVSFDYRSHLNENLTERIKDYPIQGSLLLYPARTVVSPYLVGLLLLVLPDHVGKEPTSISVRYQFNRGRSCPFMFKRDRPDRRPSPRPNVLPTSRRLNIASLCRALQPNIHINSLPILGWFGKYFPNNGW